MTEKLKRLAHKLLDYFPEGPLSAQDVYVRLRTVAKSQKEYFEYLGPESFIKLIIYIYCLLNLKDIKLAEKYLNNILFAKLIENSNENHVESCEYCSGNGYRDCNTCDGTGNETCDECDGDGKVTCTDCDGEGEIDGEACDNCDSNEEVDCENCDGSGEVTCSECSGDGSNTCDECDGNGEVETDRLIYRVETICTWSNTLKSILQTREGEMRPAISTDDFENYLREVIYLDSDEGDAELKSELEDEPNEYFSMITSDNPKLSFNRDMNITWKGLNPEDSYLKY